VIPARNEARRIQPVLESLGALDIAGCRFSVTVVDDMSSDPTANIARAVGCRVLTMARHQGVGGASRTGCDDSVRGGADIVVTMDADGQHRPEDVGALVQPIVDGAADVVAAERRFSRDMPLLFRLGNRVLNMLGGLLFGMHTRDSQCGMRAFRADAYPILRWNSDDYAKDTEIMVRLARSDLRRSAMEIPTIYLDKYKGTGPMTGLRILGHMIRWRFVLPAPPDGGWQAAPTPTDVGST
jgi:glycosyltransferase involved in cell wall biosynthesis